MSKLLTYAILISLIFSTITTPTLAKQTFQSPQTEEEAAVKITTELIQFDVVVQDKKGRIVKDLKSEDFEIYEDGKLQEVTNFSFIDLEPTKNNEANPVITASTEINPKANPESKNLQTAQRNQVGRTIAFVVDELGLPLDSIELVKANLKKYVDDKLEPTDLVAIIRTGAGVGVLQQFTNNKQQLYAAIKEIKGNLTRFNRTGVNSVEAVTSTALDDPGDSGNQVFSSYLASLREIKFVIDGLKNLPGRKSLVIFSGSFPDPGDLGSGLPQTSSSINTDSRRADVLNSVNSTNRIVTESINSLIETANRASVVCYTVDARGLLPGIALSAADDFSPASTTGTNASNAVEQQVQSTIEGRANFQIGTQRGMRTLASATGGIFSVGSETGIKTSLADQQGYYLIGYSPQEGTFDAKNPYHKLSVKVKLPGLSVRTRTGFYGIKDEEYKALTPTEELINAAISPFGAKDIYLQVTPLFSYDKKNGSLVRSLLYIDCKNLTFTDEGEDLKKANLELLIFTFGKNGNLINRVIQTSDLKVKKDKLPELLNKGFAIILNTPAKLSGTYQVRAVVRDTTTKKLGSAGQLVEIPEIKSNKLTLSGLTLAEDRTKDPARNSELELITLATRKFHSGALLQYSYHIYNPKLDSKVKKPTLKQQTILYREGKQIFTNEAIIDTKGQRDLENLLAGGKFVLGTELSSGRYTFQVVVTDLANKNRVQSQEMDFEILEK
ncbi:MAG: VWA domain-containing protein [Blastocatellia bacterium]